MFFLMPVMIFLIPIVGLPIVSFVFCDSKKFRISALISLSLFFSIMGYYFIPNANTDLSRYFVNYVDFYRNFSLDAFFHQIVLNNPFFVIQEFLFFISSRFNTDQILPLLTMFFVYLNGFFIIKEYSIVNKLQRSTVFKMLVLFIMIAPFSTLVNNTRNILAVSVISLAIFLDMYLKKHNILVFLLYFVGASIHIAVIPIIAMRLLVSFLLAVIQKRTKIVLIDLLFIVAGSILIMRFGLIETLFSKAGSYLSGGEGTALGAWFSAADNSGVQLINKYSAFFVLVIMGSMIVLILINKDRKFSQAFFTDELNIFFIGVFCSVVFLIFRPGTTWFRYYMFFLFFVPLMYVQVIKLKERVYKNILLFVLFLYSLLMLVVQIYVFQTQTDITQFISNVFGSPIWGLLKIKFIH